MSCRVPWVPKVNKICKLLIQQSSLNLLSSLCTCSPVGEDLLNVWCWKNKFDLAHDSSHSLLILTRQATTYACMNHNRDWEGRRRKKLRKVKHFFTLRNSLRLMCLSEHLMWIIILLNSQCYTSKAFPLFVICSEAEIHLWAQGAMYNIWEDWKEKSFSWIIRRRCLTCSTSKFAAYINIIIIIIAAKTP